MITLTFTGHAHEVLAEMELFVRKTTEEKAPSTEALQSLRPVGTATELARGYGAGTGEPADNVYAAAAEVLYGTSAIEEKAAPIEEPKRKRRTKAEIEAEKTTNISASPEHRVDPEVEAQDAADEAAETAQTDDAPKVFSRDDVRSRMTTLLGLMPGNEAEKYQKFATLATPIFNAVLGAPPDGETWRIGLIADNVEHFALLCEGFDIAIRGASNG